MMREQVNRDVQLPLEELLLDLRGSSGLTLGTYAEEDDSVTRVLELPEAGAAEWLVALNAREQRSFTTDELRWSLAHHELRPELLVWRRGLPAWQMLGDVAELRRGPAQSPPGAVAAPAPQSPPAAMAAPVPQPPAPEPRSAAPLADTGAAPPEIDLERLAQESGSLRVKRAVMGVSALAMTGVFITLFALSSTSEDRVRQAARQREAAAALEAAVLEAAEGEAAAREREKAPSVLDLDDVDVESEPPARRTPRARARGVPRGAAAMVLDSDEGESVEGVGRAGAIDGARQRL